MASFSITDITSLNFNVTFTLGYTFDKRYYQEIGISLGEASDSTVAPTNILGSARPVVEESTSYSVSFTYNYDSSYLIAGNTYTIYAYAKDVSNNYYWKVGTGITITIPQDTPSYPDKPTSPHLKKRYLDGYYAGVVLNCSVKGGIGKVEYKYRKTGDSDWQDVGYYTNAGQTIYFGGLDFGTEYEFRTRVFYTNDIDMFYPSEWSNSFYTVTAPNTYSFTASTALNSTLSMLNQIQVTNYPNVLGNTFSFGTVTVKSSSNTITSDNGLNTFYQEKQSNFYYSNLADDDYEVTVHIYLEYGNELIEPVDEYGNVVYYYKTLTVARPSKFYWTEAETKTFNEHGKVTDITFSRINEMLTYVEDMMSYKGLLYDEPENKYETGRFNFAGLIRDAKLTAKDKKLYAQKFNIINYCINQMLYTGLVDKVTGEVVYGEYFTKHLLDTLNSV